MTTKVHTRIKDEKVRDEVLEIVQELMSARSEQAKALLLGLPDGFSDYELAVQYIVESLLNEADACEEFENLPEWRLYTVTSRSHSIYKSAETKKIRLASFIDPVRSTARGWVVKTKSVEDRMKQYYNQSSTRWSESSALKHIFEGPLSRYILLSRIPSVITVTVLCSSTKRCSYDIVESRFEEGCDRLFQHIAESYWFDGKVIQDLGLTGDYRIIPLGEVGSMEGEHEAGRGAQISGTILYPPGKSQFSYGKVSQSGHHGRTPITMAVRYTNPIGSPTGANKQTLVFMQRGGHRLEIDHRHYPLLEKSEVERMNRILYFVDFDQKGGPTTALHCMTNETRYFAQGVETYRGFAELMIWLQYVSTIRMQKIGCREVDFVFSSPPERVLNSLSGLQKDKRIYFADKEGPGSGNRWGQLVMRVNDWAASVNFWSSTKLQVPKGSRVYVKGKTYEEKLIGNTHDICEWDMLLPWEHEPTYVAKDRHGQLRERDFHSPLGGVIQMAVRTYCLLQGVPYPKFTYTGAMARWHEDSRYGKINFADFTFFTTDVVVVRLNRHSDNIPRVFDFSKI